MFFLVIIGIIVFLFIAFVLLVVFNELFIKSFRLWVVLPLLLITSPIRIVIVILERISFNIIYRLNKKKYTENEAYYNLKGKCFYISDKISGWFDDLDNWKKTKEKQEKHKRAIFKLYELMAYGNVYINFKKDAKKNNLKFELRTGTESETNSHVIASEIEEIISEKLEDAIQYEDFFGANKSIFIEGKGEFKKIDNKNIYQVSTIIEDDKFFDSDQVTQIEFPESINKFLHKLSYDMAFYYEDGKELETTYFNIDHKFGDVVNVDKSEILHFLKNYILEKSSAFTESLHQKKLRELRCYITIEEQNTIRTDLRLVYSGKWTENFKLEL